MTQTEEQLNSGRRSSLLAASAIVCVVLSWFVLNYGIYLIARYVSDRQPIIGLSAEQLFRLCPLPGLVIFRHSLRPDS